MIYATLSIIVRVSLIILVLWGAISAVRTALRRNSRPNFEDDCTDEFGEWSSGAGGGCDRLHEKGL